MFRSLVIIQLYLVDFPSYHLHKRNFYYSFFIDRFELSSHYISYWKLSRQKLSVASHSNICCTYWNVLSKYAEFEWFPVNWYICTDFGRISCEFLSIFFKKTLKKLNLLFSRTRFSYKWSTYEVFLVVFIIFIRVIFIS